MSATLAPGQECGGDLEVVEIGPRSSKPGSLIIAHD